MAILNFRCLYALTLNQCLQKKMKFVPFYVNHTPSDHLRLPKEKIFPGPSQLPKLNQFKPVSVSGKSMEKKSQIFNFSH